MTSITVRLDEKVKQGASKVFQSYGLDLNTGTKMFITSVFRTGQIPLTFSDEEAEDRADYLAGVKAYEEFYAGDQVTYTLDETREALGL